MRARDGVSRKVAFVSAAAGLILGWVVLINGSGRVAERTLDLDYLFKVRDLPEAAGKLIAWVPLPSSDEYQRLEGFDLDGAIPHEVITDPEYGNRFLRMDLSGEAGKEKREVDVSVRFHVSRKAYRADESPRKAIETSPYLLKRFLAPDRLVPVDGKIAGEAMRVAGACAGPLERARKLYDHIVSTVTYDKSGNGWGRGDALYACDVRKGNCTDFHSLFIGEARSLGIPARFIMGLPLPDGASEGEIAGYHCWAEFYVEGRGWVPLDASEASRKADMKDVFFGGLDENRVAFTVGRDIIIPETSYGPLNYVIYPYVELDGSPYGKVDTSLQFRNTG